MADIRISTPNGLIPNSPAPIVGKDYTILPGDPQDGDLILRDGKTFMQYHPTYSSDPEPPAPDPIDVLTQQVSDLSAKIDAMSSAIGAVSASLGASQKAPAS